ncbi:FlgL Flagellin and related hook-associated proteins [Burkholderiales bacterium]
MQSWHLNCFNPLNLLRLSAHHDPMSSINANSVSTVAQLSLVKTERQMATAMQRLSTGLKINSAGDSPVGISTASLLNQKVLGLTKAVENVNSAVALLQVADGATAKLSDQLTRMRELAMQAVSDTLSSDQKGYLDVEFQELRKEAARTIEQTTWSGEPLLNGKGGQPVGEVPVYRVTSSTIQSESLLSSEPAFSVEGVGLTEDNLSNEFVGPSSWRLAGTLQASIANNRVTATYTVGDAVYTLSPKTFDPALGRVVFSDDDGLNGLVLRGTVIFRVEDENDAAIDLTGDTVTLTAAYSGALSAVSQGDLQVNGVDIGSSKAEDDTLSPPSNAQASAIARAAAINRVSEHTGVHAKVNENIMTGTAMSRGPEVSGRITINGETTKLVSSVPNNPEETRRRLVFAINAISEKTGVTAINAGADERGMTLVAKDGRNIEISFETGADPDTFGARMGLRQGVQTASISLEAKIGAPITLTSETLGDISSTGFQAGEYEENRAVFKTAARPPLQPSVAQVDAVRIEGPVNTQYTQILINDTLVTTTNRNRVNEQDVRDDLITAINNASSSLGVTASRGRTEYELLITSSTPGTPFSVEIPTQIQSATLIPESITENHLAKPTLLTDGSLVINGEPIRATRAEDDLVSDETTLTSKRAASAIAMAAAINESSAKTGVIAQATPAQIEGVVVDTSTMASGDYTLYLNGVGVSIPVIKDELPIERRVSVMNAINATFGLHGVEAVDNGYGITLSTRDGRNLSAWYDSSIVGLSAATFGLDAGDGGTQITSITLEDIPVENPQRSGSVGGLSVSYSNYRRGTETIRIDDLVNGFNTNNANAGAIQVDGDGHAFKVLEPGRRVYMGTLNETDLTASSGGNLGLTVNTLFTNGSIQGYANQVAPNGGWSVSAAKALLNGVSTLSVNNRGVTTPVPYPNLGASESDVTSGSFRTEMVNGSTGIFAADGSLALISENLQLTSPGGTVRGPTMVSMSRMTLDAGDSVSFRFKATAGDDTYALYAYLIDPDRPNEPILVTDQSGANSTAGVSSFTNVSKTLGANESGSYYLVVVGGSKDTNNDGVAGATIEVDSFTTTVSSDSGVRFTANDFSLIEQNLVYTDSINVDVAINGVTLQPAVGVNAQATATNLYNELLTALSNGTIQNISVSAPINGQIQITSTRAGLPFTVTQARVGGDDGLSISTETLVANAVDSGAVRGIENATETSSGATTVYGGVALYSSEPIQTDALLAVTDQPQARPFTLTVGAAGYAESSSFYSLGFQTGSFGGQSSRDLSPPDVSRFTFQIGTVDDEQLSIDLPNLARVGSATREIVFGEPGGPDDSGLTLVGRDTATEVLDMVDRALEELSAQRANLGGASSRLALRITTLGEEQLNFSAARSAVEDLDYALEASELAKTQIMKEATTAVISQANTSMRRVLDLLRS